MTRILIPSTAILMQHELQKIGRIMNAHFTGGDKTRLRVLRTIKEPIEDMTVSEISAAAGISRQAFYSLFSSKYDIAHWYLRKAAGLFLFEIGRTLSLNEGLSRYFDFLDKERPFLSKAFERKPDKRELRERLAVLESEILWTAASKGAEVDDDLKFCIAYTVESANCLVASWCIHGSAEEDAATVARRLAMCVPTRLLELSDPEESTAKTRFGA